MSGRGIGNHLEAQTWKTALRSLYVHRSKHKQRPKYEISPD